MEHEATGPYPPAEDQATEDHGSVDSAPDGDLLFDEPGIVPADGDSLPSLINLSLIPSPAEHSGPALPYPVVGFGASAGGLQAFREVLEHLPAGTGIAFVLITHLSPDHPSHLAEILGQSTDLPILPVEDGVQPLPNHIYVLLPNEVAELRGGTFHVSERQPGFHGSLVINSFFTSLAADQKGYAIGVVLSGSDSDGAYGLKTIKSEGGIVLVQSPSTAAEPGMPRNSILSDHVDLIIPPDAIAVELGRLAIHLGRAEIRLLEHGDASADDPMFQRILQLLRNISGLELRQYKPETLKRRIARRMVLLRQNNLAEYYALLQFRPEELRNLEEDVLIGVTRFFRDPGFWDSLVANVLPDLLHDRSPHKPLRIWCAGCSSGEEAYSLAIVAIEYLTANGLEVPLQVFGTDASERSIEAARSAIYPESIAHDISPERLRRFFVRVDRGYQVAKRLRDACIFARQNLCSDPPFSHIDILSCRNVMIYFGQALQRQVMVTLHYAIENGGYMLLGSSESLREYGDIFNVVDRKHKIYRKTGSSVPLSYGPPRSRALVENSGIPRSPHLNLPDGGGIWPELELQRASDRVVLARYAPPGLVIDERLNILQLRGEMAPFIKLAPGGVSWSLLRVLKEGLATEVRNAVAHTMRENVPTTTRITQFDDSGDDKTVSVDVLPITTALVRSRCFLILFRTGETANQPRAEQPDVSHLSADEKERLVAQLRQELSSTRFHLQSLIEERDARNQELVSANEEIQCANEEMQSTNEELETTKEELQSANEELQTVNDELQQRNNSLTETGNDFNNLLTSVNIPLLMLTSDLTIRQFTPPMQRLLNVRPGDVGRSINDIRLQLSIDDIDPILHEVLDTLGTRELEVQDREGRWYLLRVRPYRTSENKIEGLVVVLLDIDQLRKSQQQLMAAHRFANTVIECVPAPIIVLDRDCNIRTANTAFRELSELGAKELQGRSLPDLVQLLWGISSLRDRLNDLVSSKTDSFEFEHQSNTQQNKILRIRAQAIPNEQDTVHLLMFEDITLTRHAEQLMSSEKEALESEVERAAATLRRTQEKLRGLAGHLLTVQEEERQRIARELHDDIGQKLSFLSMLLKSIEIDGDGDGEPTGRMQQARTHLDSLNTTVREISHRLHPAILDDLGLSPAMRALVDEFGRSENMPATFLSRNIPDVGSQPAATAIYRITQEALRNVAKHAGRTHVKVILEADDTNLHLEVRDLGMGFDVDHTTSAGTLGLGLISMKERARLAHGTFSVTSKLGEGTTVIVDLPLDSQA